MSDIVERLRVDNLLGLPGAGIIGACREAADEIESLRQQLSEVLEVKAAENASWNAAYSIQAEQIEFLRQQLAEKDAEIAQWKANSSENKWIAEECARREQELRQQLAASQAREAQLREALHSIPICYHSKINGKECACGSCESNHLVEKALALPQDTSALSAMIAKASEVMQERCADACISFGESTDLVFGEEFAEEIRALPGVTLEDLQK